MRIKEDIPTPLSYKIDVAIHVIADLYKILKIYIRLFIIIARDPEERRDILCHYKKIWTKYKEKSLMEKFCMIIPFKEPYLIQFRLIKYILGFFYLFELFLGYEPGYAITD